MKPLQLACLLSFLFIEISPAEPFHFSADTVFAQSLLGGNILDDQRYVTGTSVSLYNDGTELLQFDSVVFCWKSDSLWSKTSEFTGIGRFGSLFSSISDSLKSDGLTWNSEYSFPLYAPYDFNDTLPEYSLCDTLSDTIEPLDSTYLTGLFYFQPLPVSRQQAATSSTIAPISFHLAYHSGDHRDTIVIMSLVLLSSSGIITPPGKQGPAHDSENRPSARSSVNLRGQIIPAKPSGIPILSAAGIIINRTEAESRKSVVTK